MTLAHHSVNNHVDCGVCALELQFNTCATYDKGVWRACVCIFIEEITGYYNYDICSISLYNFLTGFILLTIRNICPFLVY